MQPNLSIAIKFNCDSQQFLNFNDDLFESIGEISTGLAQYINVRNFWLKKETKILKDKYFVRSTLTPL